MSAAPFDTLNLAGHVGDDPAAVQENRARAAGLLGVASDRIAVLEAEHGARVTSVRRPGPLPPGDAAITTVPGLALVALAADCVPLVLASTAGTPVAGVAHCGWRGLGAGVVDATVAAMAAVGGERLHAVLGPSVCPACYPVPQERVDHLRSSLDASVAAHALRMPGSIDVAAGVRAQLDAHGIPSRTVDGCTAEDPGLFSFRRDGRTGRQGVIICL